MSTQVVERPLWLTRLGDSDLPPEPPIEREDWWRPDFPWELLLGLYLGFVALDFLLWTMELRHHVTD